MKNLSKILFLCGIIVFMAFSCEENDISQTLIDGEWILVGFGNDSTNEFISEPESEPQSSYVIFDNGKLDAFSVTNRTFDMGYTIKQGSSLSIIPGIVTLVGGDTEWGQKFLSLIGQIFKFELNGDEINLYYENQKFMKLNKEAE